MEPYATQKEKKTGSKRPKIVHLPDGVDTRSTSQRRAEKQNVKDQRRAIKKAARQQLARELKDELLCLINLSESVNIVIQHNNKNKGN